MRAGTTLRPGRRPARRRTVRRLSQHRVRWPAPYRTQGNSRPCSIRAESTWILVTAHSTALPVAPLARPDVVTTTVVRSAIRMCSCQVGSQDRDLLCCCAGVATEMPRLHLRACFVGDSARSLLGVRWYAHCESPPAKHDAGGCAFLKLPCQSLCGRGRNATMNPPVEAGKSHVRCRAR